MLLSPVLAATPESSISFWITMAIAAVIVVIFLGLLIYVARRSRSFTPTNEDKQ